MRYFLFRDFWFERFHNFWLERFPDFWLFLWLWDSWSVNIRGFMWGFVIFIYERFCDFRGSNINFHFQFHNSTTRHSSPNSSFPFQYPSSLSNTFLPSPTPFFLLQHLPPLSNTLSSLSITINQCSKYCANIIFCKPAVHCTLLTVYAVDLYIMTLFIETVFQLNT